MRVRFIGFLILLGSAGLIADARADDWPVFRHDVRRTGSSSGHLELALPAVRWRTYLGGQLSGSSFIDHDVDGDGRSEIVYELGGRIIAKKADTDLILWESRILAGADNLWGPVDVDGDGALEIMVFRAGVHSMLWFVSLDTGHVLFELPEGLMYWFRQPRLGDLDGDGHLDLYIGAGPCGRVPAAWTARWGTRQPGFAYSFCDTTGCGFDRFHELWQQENAGGSNCGVGGEVADYDGDGMAEIVVSWGLTEIGVYEGATGRLEATLTSSESLFNRISTAPIARDVTGDDVPEVFAVTRHAFSGIGSHSVVAFGYDGVGYDRLWQLVAPDSLRDRLVFDDSGGVDDFDGDGRFEVAVSIVDGATGVATLSIHDASDGTERTSLTDAELAGAVDLDGDGLAEIVASTPTGTTIVGFDGVGLVERWSLPDVVPVHHQDRFGGLLRQTPFHLLAPNLDADAMLEIVVGVKNADDRLVGLRAFDLGGTAAVETARYDAPRSVSIVAVAPSGPITRESPQIVVSTSDGFVLVLDQDLDVTNRYDAPEFSLPGMRAGGFIYGTGGPNPTPLVATVGASTGVFVRNSMGELLRLDVTGANVSNPPTLDYRVPGAELPALADVTGDGVPELVSVEGRDLVARDAASAMELWRAPDATARHVSLPAAELWRTPQVIAPRNPQPGLLGFLLGGPIPVDLGSAGAGILLETFEPDPAGDLVRVRSYMGATGAPRFTSDSFRMFWGAGNYGLASAADVDGDGAEDYVTNATDAVWISGATGTTLGTTSGLTINAASSLIADLDADGDLDAVFHGGWLARQVVELAGSTPLASGTERMELGSYGALVRCAGGVAIASGSADPGHITVERLNSGAIEVVTERVLLAGSSLAPADVPADARPGGVGNLTSVADLTGEGVPALLVGTTEGYLYALDPCDLTVLWFLDLRFPVSEPVVADVDGDGVDEVVVSVADGFLYGIEAAVYPAPVPALDIDPTEPGSEDVDIVDEVDRLMVRWTPVAGATSYEVGVLTAAGTALVSPPFRDVGDVAETVVNGLPLRLGGRYVVVVRAVGPDGTSGEALSDGVEIADIRPPEVSLTATPNAFVTGPGGSTSVFLAARDNWSLGSYALSISNGSGAHLGVLGEGALTGTSESVSVTWDGRDEAGTVLADGDYTISARVLDGVGQETLTTVIVTLGVMADAGPGVDAGRPVPVSGSCGCNAVGLGTTPHDAALALLGLLLALRLRRHPV